MKIGIVGGLGKMGSTAAEYAIEKGYDVIKIDLRGEIRSLNDIKERVDCILDFSNEEGLLSAIEYCVKNKIPLVSGTTGIKKDIFDEPKRLIPIVYSPNFSLGVNLIFHFLNSFPDEIKKFFTTYILEAHHIQKKDKPSGTAKKIGDFINPVETFSIRAKDEPGTHYIFMFGEGENIEIVHRARTRRIFAIGAILACEWILNKSPGLYSMEDIWTIRK